MNVEKLGLRSIKFFFKGKENQISQAHSKSFITKSIKKNEINVEEAMRTGSQILEVYFFYFCSFFNFSFYFEKW